MKKNLKKTLSEEEIEDMKTFFLDMKQFANAYVVDKQCNLDVNKISSKFYIENLIMSAIIESFYNGNECSYKDFNNNVYEKIPKWTWRLKLSTDDINNALAKLIRLGFIEYIGSENKYLLKFKITDNGIKALQEQTFQILAASSFFSHQTLIINKRSFLLTILMVIITVISVIVTIRSLSV